MLIRKHYTVNGLELPSAKPIELRGQNAEVIVLKPDKSEDPFATFQFDASVTKTIDPSATIRTQIEAGGASLPPAAGQFIATESREFDRQLQLVLTLLRWRNGTRVHFTYTATLPTMIWSADGTQWAHVAGSSVVNDVITMHGSINDEIIGAVQSLLDNRTQEPIGHELLQEARHQFVEHPRSGLVTGIAAAEVGFKALVAKLVPDAEWLVFHAPSPPLVNMLEEYLPTLPVKLKFGEKPFVPSSVIDVLKKGVKLRNEAIHSGKEAKRGSIEEILWAVRDLLYLLDYFGGQEWAKDRMNPNTLDEILAGPQVKKGKK